MFLRVVHSPLRCGASTFWVRLEGTVPEVLVGKINAELTMERAANAELADCCPALRLERGFWEFFSTASSTFHKDILLKCFVLPVTLEGWSNIAEYNPHSGSINYGWVAAISGSTTALDCTQTFVKTGPLEETYRPLSATTNGGNGQIVSYNTLGSLVVQPDTVYYDLHADGPMSLFGFGWDAERNPIYTMLASAGVGSSVEPDLDLTINVLNRFGEIITQLSPKGVRTIPGVTIGPDATDGQGDGDDEIVVFEWPKIHPAVHSIALSISIQNGADSFRSIRNVFCRLVDVGSSRKSLEVWRYVVPHESGPTTARSAILAIIERRPVDGWPSADTDLKAGAAGAPEAAAGDADAPWRVRTVEGYDKDPHIGFIIPKNGDILRQINGEDAKSCTGGLTSGIAQLAQGVLNGFAENKRRIDMLPRPLMLTFERPAAYADGGAGHRLAASGDPHAGTTFTLTFISEDIGVQFAERSAAMVVSGVRGLSLVCPAPGAPSPGGWLRDQAVAMATLAQMKIPGRAIAHSTLPVAIKVSRENCMTLSTSLSLSLSLSLKMLTPLLLSHLSLYPDFECHGLRPGVRPQRTYVSSRCRCVHNVVDD